MADAGRILIIPRGDYDANSTYEKLDLVKHKGISWLAKKDTMGNEPSEEDVEHWQKMFDIDIVDNLTTEDAGQVLDARQGKILDEKISETNTVLNEKIDNQRNILNEEIATLKNTLECETINSGDFTAYKYTNGKLIIEWNKVLGEGIVLSNQDSNVYYAFVNNPLSFPVEFTDTPTVTSVTVTHTNQYSPFVQATVDIVNKVRFDRYMFWANGLATLSANDKAFARFEGRWK